MRWVLLSWHQIAADRVHGCCHVMLWGLLHYALITAVWVWVIFVCGNWLCYYSWFVFYYGCGFGWCMPWAHQFLLQTVIFCSEIVELSRNPSFLSFELFQFLRLLDRMALSHARLVRILLTTHPWECFSVFLESLFTLLTFSLIFCIFDFQIFNRFPYRFSRLNPLIKHMRHVQHRRYLRIDKSMQKLRRFFQSLVFSADLIKLLLIVKRLLILDHFIFLCERIASRYYPFSFVIYEIA